MPNAETDIELADIEEDSDAPSDVDWSDNENTADGPKYTDPRGTIVWLESEAKAIPILGDNDMKSGESLGGLQLHVLSKCRRYENTWRKEQRIFKNTREIKLRIPIRTEPYMAYESDILVHQGQPSFISVWCPHYTREKPPEGFLQQHTWSCILSFYPNLVRSERDVVDGDEETMKHKRSTISQYGFVIDDTFQRAGLTIPSGSNFPSSVVSATGIAVGDPTAFKWISADGLPWWMTAWEIKNAMGFMRMTTYFNMIPEDENNEPGLACPKTGNYPFHILIIIPKTATQLRKKFSSSLGQGGYLHRDGKRYSFNGYFVGMLNTNFLQECEAHVQIPVIIPREIFQMDEPRGSTGMFNSADLSPSKPKIPKTPTKNGEPSSSTSPTPAEKKKAKIKAQMKQRLQASAPSKRNTQSSSAPSGQDTVDGNEGGSSGTAPSTQDTVAGNEGGSSDTDAGSEGAGTNPPVESTDMAPTVSEDHAAPSTATDNGKGKRVADDERLSEAVGANATKGARKSRKKN